MPRLVETKKLCLEIYFLCVPKVLSDGRTDEWGEVSDSTKLTFHDSLYFIIVTFRYIHKLSVAPVF